MEQTAIYSGPISKEQNRRFFATLEGRRVKRLIMTSSGGEVDAAIALGLWVFDQKLDIEIPEYCLSSCANYVFPAAQHKLIRSGAIVAWHGNYHHLQKTGLWKDDIAVRMERYGEDPETAERRVRAQVARLVRVERDFFHRIGVNQYLCWFGKMEPYKAPNYYFLSEQDMSQFGINHVTTPPGYENTDVSVFSDHIMYIKLGD